MDWTDDKARAAEDALWEWRVLTKGVEPAAEPDPRVIEALADDLNTAGAISVLYTLKDDPARLLASAQFLGLLRPDMGDWMTGDLAVIDSQSVPVKDVLAAMLVLASPAATQPKSAVRLPVFPAVEPGTALRFPADHGAHPEFRTEWWYVTGWLDAGDGESVESVHQADG